MWNTIDCWIFLYVNNNNDNYIKLMAGKHGDLISVWLSFSCYTVNHIYTGGLSYLFVYFYILVCLCQGNSAAYLMKHKQ